MGWLSGWPRGPRATRSLDVPMDDLQGVQARQDTEQRRDDLRKWGPGRVEGEGQEGWSNCVSVCLWPPDCRMGCVHDHHTLA